jgi:hypothetical protein
MLPRAATVEKCVARQRGLDPAPASIPGEHQAPCTCTPQAASAITASVLSELAEKESQFLRCASTLQRYHNAAQEFTNVLEGWPATWETCSPADVLVYVQRHLLPNRQPRKGSMLAASTVEGLLSSLSRAFEQRGHGADWDHPAGGRGNPLRSNLILQFKETYASECQTKGIIATSALPVSPGQLSNILASDRLIAQAHSSCHPDSLLVHTRDAAAIGFLWGCCH